ncbi:MAG: FAD/NAD(P)-binding protein [Thermoproteota archaeon]|nr:FAD/NAD(P)-binding protein [Candidatus Brockarchaeota archaeon]MBO3840442.1 FAD/NAD(P)-binding protein [Candidatus Brockarchaeota archaeon]
MSNESENPYLPAFAKVVEIRDENSTTKTFKLRMLNNKALRFRPGQFDIISYFGVGESAFSISSSPEEKDVFENTIRKVGRVTTALFNVKPGDILGVRGPYGKPWPLERVMGSDLIIIAGGMGLAPLRPVIHYIAKHRDLYGSVDILYGARTPGDMIFTYEFDSWRNIPNTRLYLTVDYVPPNTKWEYDVGVVTELLKYVKPRMRDTNVFVCGPEVMMKFTAQLLLRMGFYPSEIFLSLERRMKCGIGKCGHCQIGYKYVCKDGPVFNLEEIGLLPDVIE